MKQVAGTIMLIDKTGAPKFLVTKSAADYHLMLADQEDGRTPLATILAAIKDQLGLNVNDLRLGELSNVIIEDQDVSLFVFEWGNIAAQQLSENITSLQAKGYTFEHPKTLRGLLTQIDMSGVPHFN
ncbi:hypothetical protein [Loigolactobacillus coryniformis]|uniref:hypothetical protein n=1 Tax=Loigolactobacillus coryniformis TaxID=1610 RepID=UPI00345DC8C3